MKMDAEKRTRHDVSGSASFDQGDYKTPSGLIESERRMGSFIVPTENGCRKNR